MTESVELVPVSTSDLRKRRERITDVLDAWGDLNVRDIGADRDARLLEFELTAPGLDLPPDVRAIYREYYRRAGLNAWEIAKYTYEYHDLVAGRRLAFHLHAIGAHDMVPHAHCGQLEAEPEERGHLRAVEYDLREAHQLFMKYYASGTNPDCGELLPLRVARGQP